MGISGYKYRCVISNSVGSVTTSVKTVYINPYITANPSSVTVNAGSNATFTVNAQGSGTLTYTWYRNGATFGAANNPSFTEVGTTPSQNGNTYYCVVSTSISGTTATSSTATLTVEYAPTIGSVRFNGTTVTSNLQVFSIANGSTFTLQAVSVDDGQPNATSRGWYRYNGTSSPDPEGYNELLGASDSVTTDQGDNETQYYRYRITNTKGTTQSFEIEVNTS
jgi:carbon monoxide dehydrogenase subunit G